jgi:hypothetical protein
MKSAFLSVLVVAFAASTFVGCSSRIGDFTMITTKNYEKDKKYKMVGRMTGEDMPMMILGIQFSTPNMKTATDRAIEAGNGVYLANAVIEVAMWNAILVGAQGYRVTGDVYAPADQGDLMNPAIEKFELRDTKSGLAMVSDQDGHAIGVKDYASLVK